MLSPAQRFALSSGIEKAKIIRSNNFDAIDFDLEKYQHFIKKPIEDDANVDINDKDNVA